jgi:hypothetical protein
LVHGAVPSAHPSVSLAQLKSATVKPAGSGPPAATVVVGVVVPPVVEDPGATTVLDVGVDVEVVDVVGATRALWVVEQLATSSNTAGPDRNHLEGLIPIIPHIRGHKGPGVGRC